MPTWREVIDCIPGQAIRIQTWDMPEVDFCGYQMATKGTREFQKDCLYLIRLDELSELDAFPFGADISVVVFCGEPPERYTAGCRNFAAVSDGWRTFSRGSTSCLPLVLKWRQC